MIEQIVITINQAVKSISTWVASEKHPTTKLGNFCGPSLSLKWYNLFLKTRKVGRYHDLLVMGANVYFRFSWSRFMNKEDSTFCECPHGYRRPLSDVAAPDGHLLMLLSCFIRRTVQIYIIRKRKQIQKFLATNQ